MIIWKIQNVQKIVRKPSSYKQSSRVVCLFIYLQQVGNVFYSEETWRDLPLKKVKFFVVLFSYFRLEEKQKFKNQSASQWVQLRGRKMGFFKEALFSQPKNCVSSLQQRVRSRATSVWFLIWKITERGTEKKTRVVIIILHIHISITFDIHLSISDGQVRRIIIWYLTYPSLE